MSVICSSPQETMCFLQSNHGITIIINYYIIGCSMTPPPQYLNEISYVAKATGDHKKFSEFLAKINLGRYRKLYASVRIVEMDLPRNIQALVTLYEIYWTKRKFFTFEKYYDYYLKVNKTNIEIFRKKIGMCSSCFDKGLKARIYRTWASLLTQIHGGYQAEAVFGSGTVNMSATLDYKGIDFEVNYSGKKINFQVKKSSNHGVKSGRPAATATVPIIDMYYEVPSCLMDPMKKRGGVRIPYQRFIDDERTIHLNNGFVVFTDKMFLCHKDEIDGRKHAICKYC
jgi:hypothetical protein